MPVQMSAGALRGQSHLIPHEQEEFGDICEPPDVGLET